MANVQVVRRTKEEIAAGFPHKLKQQGVTFEDWKKDQAPKSKKNGKATPKNGSPKAKNGNPLPLMGVVRRTKEEIDAGFPIEVKRTGVTFEQWQAEQEKITERIKEQRKVIKLDPPPEPKQQPKEKIEYIKVVEKIIVETKDNRTELKELIQEAFDKCTWEWKQVPMDDKFSVSQLSTLGRQGWRLAFIHDHKIMSPGSKKPDILCFQRPKQVTKRKKK